jgi:hypothetical protein
MHPVRRDAVAPQDVEGGAMNGTLTIRCLDFKPMHKNTLRGFATIEVVELHMIFHDIAIHQKRTSRWATLAMKPQIDPQREYHKR